MFWPCVSSSVSLHKGRSLHYVLADSRAYKRAGAAQAQESRNRPTTWRKTKVQQIRLRSSLESNRDRTAYSSFRFANARAGCERPCFLLLTVLLGSCSLVGRKQCSVAAAGEQIASRKAASLVLRRQRE